MSLGYIDYQEGASFVIILKRSKSPNTRVVCIFLSISIKLRQEYKGDSPPIDHTTLIRLYSSQGPQIGTEQDGVTTDAALRN